MAKAYESYGAVKVKAAKLKRMHQNILDNGDEELYEVWVTYGVPDEPEDCDFFDIAMDEKAFAEVTELYNRLAKEF